MDFQVETHVGKLPEEVEQGLGPVALVVECTVEHPDVPDTLFVNQSDAGADGLDGQCAHRFLSSAHAERAGIETASGSLQLYERFGPVEERTLFGIDQLVERPDARQPVVVVMAFRIQKAKPRDRIPVVRLLPAGEPLRKSLFPLAPEHTVDKVVGTQEVLVGPQKLRTAQCHDAARQHGLHPAEHVYEHLVVEEPAGSRHDIGCMAHHFPGRHSRVFIDGSRHHSPLQGRVVHHLGMQGRKRQ